MRNSGPRLVSSETSNSRRKETCRSRLRDHSGWHDDRGLLHAFPILSPPRRDSPGRCQEVAEISQCLDYASGASRGCSIFSGSKARRTHAHGCPSSLSQGQQRISLSRSNCRCEERGCCKLLQKIRLHGTSEGRKSHVPCDWNRRKDVCE